MAQLELDLADDFLSELLASDFDDIAQEMLEEAAPIYKTAIQKSMQSSILHEGESEMVNSVQAQKPKKCKNGAWIVHIGPTGNSKSHYYAKNGKGIRTKRKYPVSNILKAIWKEYGIAGKQAARPWLTKAKNDAEKAVESKMQEVYNRKVGAK